MSIIAFDSRDSQNDSLRPVLVACTNAEIGREKLIYRGSLFRYLFDLNSKLQTVDDSTKDSLDFGLSDFPDFRVGNIWESRIGQEITVVIKVIWQMKNES